MILECTRCGSKGDPDTDFPKDRQKTSGYSSNCRPCHRTQNNEWKAKNPDKVRDSQLRSYYGIGLADYVRMLDAQNGVCAICQAPPLPNRNLDVDHDHDTGQIRGLLCNRCNKILGQAEDSAELLRLMADYLHNGVC